MNLVRKALNAKPRNRSLLLLLTIAAVIGLAMPASTESALAGGSQAFRIHKSGDLIEGEFDNIALTAEGALMPAPASEPLAEGIAVYIWGLVADGNGGVIAASGSEGHLYHIQSDGTSDLLADTFEYELFALAGSSAGEYFVSGAPNGTITRVDSEGEKTTLIDLPEGLIWDLLVAPDGRLFASAGQSGEIYRIAPDGETVRISAIPDAHAVCLAWWNGKIICGSDGSGLLTAIDPDSGDLEILYDTDREEIVDILPLGAERLLFAVSGQSMATSSSSNGSMVLPTIEVTPEGISGGPAVYELRSDGLVRQVYNCPEDDIFCLCPAPDGSILVGTGGEGVLYQLDRFWNATRLLDLDQNQILSLERDGQYVFAGTGNGGSVYRLDWRQDRAGTYTSPVLDAKTTVEWGAPNWVTSGNGEIAMETRTGLIETPDDTWTDWKSLAGKHIASESGRFIQWRLALEANQVTEPFKVSLIRIPFRGPNRPPRIKNLTVSPKAPSRNGTEPANGAGGFKQELPGGIRVEYTVSEPAPGTKQNETNRPGGWARNMRSATWRAVDPDGDCLQYDLFLRLVGDDDFFPLKTELEQTAFSWDASAWPEGWYEMRVVANDQECNPPGEGLEVSRLSSLFQVDNTPPVLTDLSLTWSGDGEQRQLILTGRGEDTASLIASLEISLNGDGWRMIQPADGMFDSSAEEINHPVSEMETGEIPSYVGVRVMDEIGHFDTARIRVPPEK